MKREPPFATEAALCAEFIAWVSRWPEWTAYPETAGWDILLANDDGTQIGIQAKLKFNMKVLEQAIESGWCWARTEGPDFRAVLVPRTESGADDICKALGLGAFHGSADEVGYGDSLRKVYRFSPDLQRLWPDRPWHYYCPEKRHTLPRFVPDVIAGDSAPVVLTKWKICALELVATLELRGYLTRQDFRRASVDHRRWTQDWLEPDLKSGGWRRGPALPNFEAQHPVVYPKVREEMRAMLACNPTGG